MCRLYVKAGLAYEAGEDYVITDETYDGLSQILLKRYEKLPKWFKNKISEEELSSGSAAGFQGKFLSDTFKMHFMRH